ncbi:hypothetical protein [Fibrobacter sp. UWB11]|uniref:hypothetical protein n=1 Tax=Fibrobacter sp. UWB11 TaxID=1896202 RepID=UPI00092AB52F|nr:hypothetical protein [Fibrobacter sp. UWB11]SIO40253.1 hypothetical protein SAMN05720758_2692 [Fibrobacter sp. UWB11]
MDYEYSVIGSIFCKADILSAAAENSVFTYNGYNFALRKFSDCISVSLHGTTDDTSSNISEICHNISEKDVSDVCKFLSEKYACKVSMRKGYEVYGNANVFNGGSDYEVIEEKWFKVQFENGIQVV